MSEIVNGVNYLRGVMMKGKIIRLLKLAIAEFKGFANRLVVFALMYGWLELILIALSLILPTCLHIKLGVPHEVSLTISRILLTITPIIPTLAFVKAKNELHFYCGPSSPPTLNSGPILFLCSELCK